jgi:hypothetical protein
MKKLIFVISLFAMVAIAQAQSAKTIGTLTPGAGNYFQYSGTAVLADTTRYAANTIARIFDARRVAFPLDWAATVTVTQTSGDIAGHRIYWQGSNDASNWTTLKSNLLTAATTTYTWTSTDTAARYTSYPYLRVYYTSDSGTGVATISKISVKFGEKR